ncbi:MAG: hypothetical protein MUF64_21590 [Polyangiaceae bacterium]|jgi:hypothetical protein|nr:hypothetical protein [Polyangiaceae bacterium]
MNPDETIEQRLARLQEATLGVKVDPGLFLKVQARINAELGWHEQLLSPAWRLLPAGLVMAAAACLVAYQSERAALVAVVWEEEPIGLVSE